MSTSPIINNTKNDSKKNDKEAIKKDVKKGPTIKKRKYSRNGCMECKRRKLKCDESKPKCTYCTRLARECVYSKPVKFTNTRSFTLDKSIDFMASDLMTTSSLDQSKKVGLEVAKANSASATSERPRMVGLLNLHEQEELNRKRKAEETTITTSSEKTNSNNTNGNDPNINHKKISILPSSEFQQPSPRQSQMVQQQRHQIHPTAPAPIPTTNTQQHLPYPDPSYYYQQQHSQSPYMAYPSPLQHQHTQIRNTLQNNNNFSYDEGENDILNGASNLISDLNELIQTFGIDFNLPFQGNNFTQDSNRPTMPNILNRTNVYPDHSHNRVGIPNILNNDYLYDRSGISPTNYSPHSTETSAQLSPPQPTPTPNESQEYINKLTKTLKTDFASAASTPAAATSPAPGENPDMRRSNTEPAHPHMHFTQLPRQNSLSMSSTATAPATAISTTSAPVPMNKVMSLDGGDEDIADDDEEDENTVQRAEGEEDDEDDEIDDEDEAEEAALARSADELVSLVDKSSGKPIVLSAFPTLNSSALENLTYADIINETITPVDLAPLAAYFQWSYTSTHINYLKVFVTKIHINCLPFTSSFLKNAFINCFLTQGKSSPHLLFALLAIAARYESYQITKSDGTDRGTSLDDEQSPLSKVSSSVGKTPKNSDDIDAEPQATGIDATLEKVHTQEGVDEINENNTRTQCDDTQAKTDRSEIKTVNDDKKEDEKVDNEEDNEDGNEDDNEESGIHETEDKRTVEYHTKLRSYYLSSCLKSLDSILHSKSKILNNIESLLLTILILASDYSASIGSQWRAHLRGAKDLLIKYCDNRPMSLELVIIWIWFYAMEILAGFTVPAGGTIHDFDELNRFLTICISHGKVGSILRKYGFILDGHYDDPDEEAYYYLNHADNSNDYKALTPSLSGSLTFKKYNELRPKPGYNLYLGYSDDVILVFKELTLTLEALRQFNVTNESDENEKKSHHQNHSFVTKILNSKGFVRSSQTIKINMLVEKARSFCLISNKVPYEIEETSLFHPKNKSGYHHKPVVNNGNHTMGTNVIVSSYICNKKTGKWYSYYDLSQQMYLDAAFLKFLITNKVYALKGLSIKNGLVQDVVERMLEGMSSIVCFLDTVSTENLAALSDYYNHTPTLDPVDSDETPLSNTAIDFDKYLYYDLDNRVVMLQWPLFMCGLCCVTERQKLVIECCFCAMINMGVGSGEISLTRLQKIWKLQKLGKFDYDNHDWMDDDDDSVPFV